MRMASSGAKIRWLSYQRKFSFSKDPRKVPSDTIKDIVLEAFYLGRVGVYTAPTKAVAMVPQPPINYGDAITATETKPRVRIFNASSRFFAKRSLALKLANELKLG